MKSNYRKIGEFIEVVNIKNKNLETLNLLGINIDKFFMPSVANIVGTDMTTYKLVKKNQFACNRMHVGRDYRIPIAIAKDDNPFIVSPAYDVFEVVNDKELDYNFLMLWFSRKEFDRNAWFYTDADVRGGLAWKAFCEMEIPVPSIEKQKEIVNEYNVIENRIKLNEQIIQKLEETAQAIYKQWFLEFEFPDEDGKPYKSSSGEMIWNEELGKEIPKGWEVRKLQDIAIIIMGQSPEGISYNKNSEGMIFYQGRSDFGYRFPEITTYTTQPKKKAFKNDILISVRAPVGDINIATHNCAIGRGVGAIRSKFDCNSHLFYELLNMKSHFDITDGEGTIFGSINKDDLFNMKVLCTKEIIIKFEKIISPLDNYIKNCSFQIQKLKELKNLLLSKLSTLEG